MEEPQAPVSRHRHVLPLWVKMDSNHRSRKTADLQSAPFGHSGIHPLGAASRNRTNNLRITSALLYH